MAGEAVEVATVSDVAAVIEAHDGPEAWFCASAFDGDYRCGAGWLAALGACVDIDWLDKDDGPPPCVKHDALARLCQGWSGGPLSIAWRTPNGVRGLVLLRRAVTDAEEYLRIARGILARWEAVRLPEGFAVDRRCTMDRARLQWAPRAHVKGLQREGRVVACRAGGAYVPEALAASAPPAPAPRPRAHSARATGPAFGVDGLARAEGQPAATFREAVRAMNASVTYARGACPMCGSPDGFAEGLGGRWVCWSTRHSAGLGGRMTRDETAHTGDALDLAQALEGRGPVEALKRLGWLAAGWRPKERQ